MMEQLRRTEPGANFFPITSEKYVTVWDTSFLTLGTESCYSSHLTQDVASQETVICTFQ